MFKMSKHGNIRSSLPSKLRHNITIKYKYSVHYKVRFKVDP